MSNILVTGCAGFIGSHLTEKLLSLGHRVVGLDNFDPFYDKTIKQENLHQALKADAFLFIEADVTDAGGLQPVFEKYNIDTVIHLAALAGVRNSFEHPDDYFRINTEGTKTVFETALKYGVRQFVHASSSSVYGEMKGEKAVEEETPLNPISPYAKSKVEAEKIIGSLQKKFDFDVNVLRFFTVYGPRQRPDMAFQKFRRQILKGETIELYGENMSRDFTPIEKIISGIVASLNHRNGFEIFNLGSGERVLVRDMILQIGEELGASPQIKVVNQQKGDPSFTLADVRKAQNILNYH